MICPNCRDSGMDPTGYPCNCEAGHTLYEGPAPTLTLRDIMQALKAHEATLVRTEMSARDKGKTIMSVRRIESDVWRLLAHLEEGC